MRRLHKAAALRATRERHRYSKGAAGTIAALIEDRELLLARLRVMQRLGCAATIMARRDCLWFPDSDCSNKVAPSQPLCLRCHLRTFVDEANRTLEDLGGASVTALAE